MAAIALAMTSTIAWAQSATSGMISGAVVDASNAIIPGATVTLKQNATNTTQSTVTDSAGRYLFPAVAPGDYTLTVTKAGFQTSAVNQVHVEIARSATYNFTLKVGQVSQTVEVTSTPGAQVETSNASIGTTIGGDELLRLPTAQRNVTALLSLQPAVTPMVGNDVFGGQVAGAASDQTTFLVDGGDATSDLEGTNSYSGVPGQPQPSPFISVSVETTQEFRVVTAGPTSNLNRSQGGQILIDTKTGTNKFHGSAYEYYTGSALGANTWNNNRIGLPRPNVVNNRFGFSLGGPFLKNRLFFFGNYEGRRFRQSTSITTDVPTALARQGILQFKDAAGSVNQYNLATSTLCGSAGTTQCDPRGIGIDPVIQQYWNLEPLPNDPSAGDGLNSEGFTRSYADPDNENYGLLRLDFKINDRWSLFTTYRQQKIVFLTGDQFSIIPSQQKLISGTPNQPRFTTFGLTGTIGSSFTTELHGSYMYDWWGWNRATLANPSGITGLGGTLQVSGEGRLGNAGTGKPWADPTNFNTQSARARFWAGKDWYLADDSSWLHGKHTIQFGGSWYFWNIIHQRTDNVLGGLTNGPIYWVGSRHMSSGSFVDTPGSEAPPACTSTLLTNCLLSSDATRWDSMYSAMLGLLDHSSQVATANAQFLPNPLGTPATDHVHIGSFYAYVGDVWQMKPSLTLNYGLSYGVQFPPRELSGLQVLQQYTATGTPVRNLPAYFQARQAALDRGNPYPSLNDISNPSFEFSPIGGVPGYTRPINTFWGSLGPHVAIAWQPSFENRIFGNHQTVIRAGYSLQWNRTNAVGLVLTPLLGDGLMQIVSCNAPVMASSGVPAGTCSGARTNASNAFRVGIDGNSVTPPAPNSGFPLVPGGGLSSTFGFNIDPAITPPWSHEFTFDIERSFSHGWMIDAGYIGRLTHNLESGGDINASDMFAKDPVSGQTLAQAFDAVSTFFRGGGSCSTVAKVATCPGLAAQPFFENMAVPGGVPGAGANFCQTTYGGSCTAVAAQGDSGDAINGSLGGFMEFNYNFIAQAPLDPSQFVFNFWNWGGGWSNYNAGFITVKKSFSQGLNLSFSYTYSHSLGTQTLNQQYIIYGNPSPFDPATGYTSEPYDRRHVANAAWYYVLPFGRGRRFSSENGIVNRIVGGWYTSGIWTWQSGLPLCAQAGGDYGDIAGSATGGTCAVSSIPLTGLTGKHVGVGRSGINMFANPTAVFNSLSRPLLSQNLRPYNYNMVGFPLWNVDMSVGKNVVATERFKAILTADFFNVFNLMMPANPNLSMNNPSAFGVVTGQANGPRVTQLGLRFEF
ncbi:MAG: TonB-dependent receptor [Candidatus Acidiferrales bacterium]